MTTLKYYMKKRSARRKTRKGGGNCMSSGTCFIPNEELNDNTASMTPTQKLTYAVERNDLEKVKEAVNEGANINGDINTSAHETPLLSAIYNDNVEIVKYLLSQKNTDINIRRLGYVDYNQYTTEVVTPVILATRYRRKSILDMLLRHGAKVDNRYYDVIYSPMLINLQKQIQTENDMVPELLTKKKMFTGLTEITRAYVSDAHDSASNKVFTGIKNNNFNLVKNTIESRIVNEGVTDPSLRNTQFNEFITSKNEDGDTFLIAAARIGNVEIVKYLLDIMDRDVITIRNNTFLDDININNAENAIMVAAARGHMEIVSLLLELDHINLNNRYPNGLSVLDIMIDAGNVELVKKLVDKGASLYNGRTSANYFPKAVVDALKPHVPIEILEYLLQQRPIRTGLTDEYMDWVLTSYEHLTPEKKALLEQYARTHDLETIHDLDTLRRPRRAGGKRHSQKRRRNKKKNAHKTMHRARK